MWSKPKKPELNLPFDVAPLKRRLAALAVDDPLHALLKGYLHACMVGNAAVLTESDADATKLVGRQNMLTDLVADWEELWRDAHQPPKKA